MNDHSRTDEVREIVAELQFRDWHFQIVPAPPYGDLLRVTFVAGADGRQNGRKWLISQHATRSEIVQTAFKAVLTALEHETREQFLYRGQAVFGPHFDVDSLAALALARRFDEREPMLASPVD